MVANDIADGHLVALPFDITITRGPVGLMHRPDDVWSSQARVFGLAVNNAIKTLRPIPAQEHF